MRVKKADLGQLIPLAKGGFGEVFRVPGYHLPGDHAALAYKEFTSEVDAQARSAEAAVSFRERLGRADRDDLDRCTVWPRALVEDKGKVAGLLMPLIPGEFFCDRADPDTGDMTSKPRDMQWLIASAEQRAAARIDLRDVDKTERLILLGHLVYDLGRLHKHDWVFGDLSFKNAVFALDPPRVMLLDCDGAAALTDFGRSQASTPMWDPPECSFTPVPGVPQQDLQDKVTDVYKLGLAILRCLSPGKGAASSRSAGRVAGELDTEGEALVERAVDTDRSRRPSAKELYGYLRKVVAARIQPPAVLDARLVTPFRVRGMDARLEWQIKHATEVTVTTENGRTEMVGVTGDPQSYTFRPQASGPVFIEVANRFGKLRVDLGEITLYELPPFEVQLGYLPRLEVPPLRAFTLDAMRPALESVPRVRVPQVPPVPSLPTSDLLGIFQDALMPGVAVPLQLPRLADAISEAWHSVASSLATDAKKNAESMREPYLASQANAESQQ